jgi:MarR family transcriptional regulator, organic hydroperoxide resistance regulator
MKVNHPGKTVFGKQTRRQEDPGREAWRLLLDLFKASQGALQAVWAEFDVSSAQGDLLSSLKPGEPVSMVSLARSLRCHDSNVTGLVDRLEQRGLIERRGDPGDRRIKLIALTNEGEALRQRLLERFSEPLPFIVVLSAKDKAALRGILQRAAKAMESDSAER